MATKRLHLIIIGIWGVVLIAVIVLFRSGDDMIIGQNNIQVDEQINQTHTPVELTRIIGRWQRSEGEYILDIRAVRDDGKIDAVYLNPRPINVSKAQAITKGGYVIVAVTLQDSGYPGNIYTLTYDAQADRLDGVYHHRGLGQQFNVEFSRVSSAQIMRE